MLLNANEPLLHRQQYIASLQFEQPLKGTCRPAVNSSKSTGALENQAPFQAVAPTSARLSASPSSRISGNRGLGRYLGPFATKGFKAWSMPSQSDGIFNEYKLKTYCKDRTIVVCKQCTGTESRIICALSKLAEPRF